MGGSPWHPILSSAKLLSEMGFGEVDRTPHLASLPQSEISVFLAETAIQGLHLTVIEVH